MALDNPATWWGKTVNHVTAAASQTAVAASTKTLEGVGPFKFTEESTTISKDLSYVNGNSTLTLTCARRDFYVYGRPGDFMDMADLDAEDAGEEFVKELTEADTTRDNVLTDAEIDAAGTIRPMHLDFREVSHFAFDVGVVHDLGGGAALNAGFGSVPVNSSTTAMTKKNKASIGLTSTF